MPASDASPARKRTVEFADRTPSSATRSWRVPRRRGESDLYRRGFEDERSHCRTNLLIGDMHAREGVRTATAAGQVPGVPIADLTRVEPGVEDPRAPPADAHRSDSNHASSSLRRARDAIALTLSYRSSMSSLISANV